MTKPLSRRDFLKLGGLSLGGLALKPLLGFDALAAEGGKLGRVSYPSVSVFDAPRLDANTVGYRFRDELLNLYYNVTPLSGPAYNPLWHRIWGGYVHSAHVQPVAVRYSELMSSIPEGGQLTELTVPYSTPFSLVAGEGWQATENFRLYYGSTHWVTGVEEGPDGEAWYEITDELWEGYKYYVPAKHLTPIPDRELTPLSPNVPTWQKRVEISLEWQSLTAYEGDQVVLQAPVSSGINSRSTNGIPTQTPTGTFHIQLKMPSKHMGNSRLTDTLDDRALPGVPWTCFFDARGYAIHGTYWHNNFGTPMSHGCVNLTIPDAEWLYNWASYGTTVKVHY